MRRAQQTTSIIQEQVPTPMIIEPLVREQEIGLGRDVVQEQVEQFKREETLSRGYLSLGRGLEVGESYQMVIDRADEFWEKLITGKYINQLGSEIKRILVVSHGRFMSLLVGKILDVSSPGFFLAIDNCSYLVITISQNWRPQIILSNS